MTEENKKVAKKVGPTLVKKKHAPTNKSVHAAEAPAKKVVRKVVRKVAVKKTAERPQEQKVSRPQAHHNNTKADRNAGNASAKRKEPNATRTPHTQSPLPGRKLTPEQLERLREARRKAQPSVQFEVTRPPRKRTAGDRRDSQASGKNFRPRQGGTGANKSLNKSVAPAGSMPPPPPPAGGNQKSRGGGPRRSSKEREKQDRRREDLEHFASQIKKKKAYTAADVVPKEISIMESITVSELARKMNLKASDIIGQLMKNGTMANINQAIDADTASVVAQEFNCKVNVVSLYEETLIESEDIAESDYVKRAPVVTIMGHVDHGKTTLLDALRESEVANSEHGGITQHIGAYQVHLPSTGETITFLDTPGHAAFTMMRARGAQITDLIVLIVAADDGVMPQTVEAIHHAKEAKVPIVVAITKADLEAANPDRIKQQLSEHGLMPSDWGGQISYVEVSAFTKQGLPELLETIILETEILELKAPTKGRAEGKVIEAKIDQGRGIVATVLIERGTLRIGDAYVAGVYSGRVRAMFNEYGERLEVAVPSTPVEIIGLSGA
ncbi:MAG: translation initiation factor IF-2, partial [Spirochaetota bacterium]